jgi:hypothetical protein
MISASRTGGIRRAFRQKTQFMDRFRTYFSLFGNLDVFSVVERSGANQINRKKPIARIGRERLRKPGNAD